MGESFNYGDEVTVYFSESSHVKGKLIWIPAAPGDWWGVRVPGINGGPDRLVYVHTFETIEKEI